MLAGSSPPLAPGVAVLAALKGAAVGSVLTGAAIGVTSLELGAEFAIGFFVAAVFLGFVIWLLGIFVATPIWLVLHDKGLTGARPFAAAGLVAPLGAVFLFPPLFWLVLAVVGPVVGVVIQRAYYGKTAS